MHHTTIMSTLTQYIHSYFQLSDDQAQALSGLFQETELARDDFFCREGSHHVPLSFVREGHLRVFQYRDGKDITQWITSEGEFITDLSELVFRSPARWNIQALTNCRFYTISSDDYQRLPQEVPQWDRIEKLFIAKCFTMLEDRVFSFLSMTAEERVHFLMSRKPELFNQVPLHYLASMLGMTPETLSRIRRKRIS